MKKIKFLMLFLFFSIILTGCGKKSLSCSKEEDIDAGKMNENQVITFKNDKIYSYDALMTIELNDEYMDYKDVFVDSLESSMSEYKDKEGIKYNTTKKDNQVSITINGIYSQMDDDTKESLGISKNSSFNEIKQSLEEEGYTCN